MKFTTCYRHGCHNIIPQSEIRLQLYCSSACRQRAYRDRKRAMNAKGKIVGTPANCLNCGDRYIKRMARHMFCSDSCRVNYWQQMKRIDQEEIVNE